jgi:hypothetical protein
LHSQYFQFQILKQVLEVTFYDRCSGTEQQ